MNDEKYEQQVDEQRLINLQRLEEFEVFLKESGLSDATVKKHMENIDFYVNHFLFYEEAIPLEKGIKEVEYFFSYWFPRKAMWANASSVNATCTALKKFYSFLQGKGKVTVQDVADLHTTIKSQKKEWLSNHLY